MRPFLVAFCFGFLLVALATDDFIQRRVARTVEASFVDLVESYIQIDDSFVSMTESAQRFCEMVKVSNPDLESNNCDFGLDAVKHGQAEIRKLRQAFPADWKGQRK